jgi:hypothetical protein
MIDIGTEYAEVKSEFDGDGKKINKRKNRLLADERVQEYITKQRVSERRNFHARFALRCALIDSFYRSSITRTSSWKMEGILPLNECDAGPAEILIYDSDQGDTIVVLSLIQEEESAEIHDRCERIAAYLESERDPVGDELGVEIGDFEIAVAVSEVDPDGSGIRPTEVPETWSNSMSETVYDGISIWHFDWLDSKELTVVDSFTNLDWDAHIPPGDLGTELQNGINVDHHPHLSFEFFLDSHPQSILQNLAKKMFKSHESTETTNSYFSKSELKTTLLTGARNNDTDAERTERANQLINIWKELSVVTDAPNPDSYDEDDDVYAIDERMAYLNSGIRNLQTSYTQAMEEAIAEFDLINSELN